MKTTKNTKSTSVKSTAAKAQGLVQQAQTVLAVGQPLAPKAKKEVMGASLYAIPAFVAAAVSAYGEHAALLGDDLDPSAALDAMDYVTENAPVLASLRSTTKALGDRVYESKATSAKFALAVYDRLRANAALPQGAAVQPRLTAMEALIPRRKRKPVAATPATEAAPSQQGTAAVAPAATQKS
jgi:hypothetical protein